MAVKVGPVLLVRPVTVHVLPQLMPVPLTEPLTGVVTVSAYVGLALKLAVTEFDVLAARVGAQVPVPEQRPPHPVK